MSQPTLLDMTNDARELNWIERHDQHMASDITNKVPIKVLDFARKINAPRLFRLLSHLGKVLWLVWHVKWKGGSICYMKFIGQAQISRTSVETNHRILGQPLIVYWDNLFWRKKKSYKKNTYLFLNKFDEMKIRCKGVEDTQKNYSPILNWNESWKSMANGNISLEMLIKRPIHFEGWKESETAAN